MTAPKTHRSFHDPVMVDEIAEVFATVGGGLFVDATLGGGGHAELLLRQHPQRRLLGVDRDPEAIAAARERLAPFADRVTLCCEPFDRLGELIDAAACGPLVGVLFDFGVSSHQLDTGERGFSHRHDAPLDMRMDPRTGRDAGYVVNRYGFDELRALLRRHAGERHAGRIAAAIVAARPLCSTCQLVDVVTSAVPAAARRARRHPAMRTFAAIRIEVNDELNLIDPALRAALSRLAPRGRLATLAYHSGEDSIVKIILREAADGVCQCPSTLPCICGAEPSVRLLRRKVTRPSAAEVERNPRAASALLRAAERLEPAHR
ncbi:16S rRNA (cytosine(1402)-N(4))-methyltransferase RsmH [Candidatus Poriferisodalis sp.]|uniref:16S rRNA (cytosine(1402)-N(4))-methyltransferase RsmH n=1 Tax=Candidatus Poriferisodalis sp. TaxID=3101277 RepID=UPI003B028412